MARQRVQTPNRRQQAQSAPKRKKAGKRTTPKDPSKNPGGQPSKLTEDVISKVLTGIRLGQSLERAAQSAGISERSLYNYRTRGREVAERLERLEEIDDIKALRKVAREAGVSAQGGFKAILGRLITPEDERYLQFLQDSKSAEADREQRWLLRIKDAADNGTWQAAAWLAERTNPQGFGQRTRLEHTGKDGEPIEVEAVSPREAIRGKLIAIAGRQAESSDHTEAATG